MKNFKLKPLNLLFNLVVAILLFTALGGAPVQVSAAIAVTAGVVLGFAKTGKKQTGLAFMAVQKEIWENHIEEEIFKDNGFLLNSYNAGDYVLEGKVVHIPQSGGSGNVVKNRTSLPANVRKRSDTDVTYPIDEFTTDPVLIPNADTHELSYDKRTSVLGEDQAKLNQVIAEEMLYNWVNSPLNTTSLPATAIFKTTGDARVASAPGATGNRKKSTLTDLQKMATYLRRNNRWFEGKMCALLTPQMQADLFPADSVVTATYMQSVTEEERRAGVMYKVQGWKIMGRSSVLITSAAFAIKAPGAATAIGDNEASLFWYDGAVERAVGSIKMFAQPDAPQYYGDMYSFLVRIGGRARRTNYEGIALLTEDLG